MLQIDFKVVSLADLLQWKRSFTYIYVNECFVYNALKKISSCLHVGNKALFTLVMSRNYLSFAGVPSLVLLLIKEAAMLDHKHAPSLLHFHIPAAERRRRSVGFKL